MSTKKTSPGRPRDESIRMKILHTAVAILTKRGYEQTTMNEIALQAKVGKQTLYRWWKNRAELLMEAMALYAEENVGAPDAEKKVILKNYLIRTFSSVNRETGAILKSLIAESISDKKFSRILFNTFILKRQQALSKIILECTSVSSEDEDTLNALVDMIFGAMWYRIIFEHRPLDENLAVFYSDMVMNNTYLSIKR